MDAQETSLGGPDELRLHGGNLAAARRQFPNARDPWIDLSTGINPVPYSVGAVAPSAWTRLPESADVAALEKAARAAYGACASTEIVAAPGTQALIQWLPRLFPARRVGILGFTYGEHETCRRVAGADVAVVEALADLVAFDVGVVVNPNNPDGRLTPPQRLAEIAAAFARRGGMLIVDEAFMDMLGRRHSVVPVLPEAGALVLRSFGKVYGLAGLRLGFAACSTEVGALLRKAIGPWAVSGPAIEIGRRALADEIWLETTVARLRDEASRLDALLQAASFEIVGGTPLFRLAARRDATTWFERLGRAGILTRPFPEKPGWLRFGIPHAPDDWARLAAALR